MTEHILTLLHLSDLHVRAAERSSWRRRRVLGRAWADHLDRLSEDGPYDLVCCTGDAAFAGQPREYEQATDLDSQLSLESVQRKGKSAWGCRRRTKSVLSSGGPESLRKRPVPRAR